MTRPVRERMVASAATLLATRGLQATSFSEVLAASQSPRGSVYHHFPGGKDQLVREALHHVAERTFTLLEQAGATSAEDLATAFLDTWRWVLSVTSYAGGCAVVAVTVAAESDDLVAEAGGIFRDWRERLAGKLTGYGIAEPEATTYAALLLAASEGAVLLSRAERGPEPFEMVAADLVRRARELDDLADRHHD